MRWQGLVGEISLTLPFIIRAAEAATAEKEVKEVISAMVMSIKVKLTAHHCFLFC
jgi:hypothetical protein